MTRVKIFRSESGAYSGFHCKGHAGYAEAGEDIVCAGISAIVINTINCLEDLLHEDLKVEYGEKKGGDISCTFVKEPGERAQFLIDCMIHGLEWIQRQYGKEYLEYEIKEV